MKNTKGMRVATVWRLCLEMWDWIVERIKAGDARSIWGLKDAWLLEHGYDLHLSCFFCDFKKPGKSCVTSCPGVAIHPRFYCDCKAYHYSDKPLKFCDKLHRMDKKRRQMNREKRSK